MRTSDKSDITLESYEDSSGRDATRPVLMWSRSQSSEEATLAEDAGISGWLRSKVGGLSEDRPVARPRSSAGSGCAAGMLVCTVAAALTTMVAMLGWVLYKMVWPEESFHLEPPTPAMVEEKLAWFDFAPECGTVEKNVEYEVDLKSAQHLDHIPSWEMCCAMCHGIPSCEAWVWKENKAIKEGEPHSCFVLHGEPQKRISGNHSKGIVSGLPPKRPPLLIQESGEKIRLVQELDTGEEDAPSTLYCVALVQPHGYEKDFMEFQHSLRTSMFGCDAFGVYSNSSFWVAPGVWTGDIDYSLECELGGEFGTALNSWIFMAFWRKVLADGLYRKHDWTVKADADAVFFPQRLRRVLQAHTTADYINNCKYGLHGPLEVLHRRALEALERDFNASEDGQKPLRCHGELLEVLEQWGEDYWLDKCLSQVLGLRSELDGGLLCEANCDCEDWYWCKNTSVEHVSYHPFKREDMYRQCMANAMNQIEARAWR